MELNSLDRLCVNPNQVLCVTLTYPDAFPNDPAKWRLNLNALKKRLERRYGKHAVYCKLEQQQRGAPHWHLLLLAGPQLVDALKEFRVWLADAWYEVCASGDERHREAGTQAKRAQNWRDVDRFIRYIGKRCPPFVDIQTGEVLSVGRWWSIWNRNFLPVEWRTAHLSERAYDKVTRMVRRYLHWKRFRTSTARAIFVPARVIERLVDWADCPNTSADRVSPLRSDADSTYDMPYRLESTGTL